MASVSRSELSEWLDGLLDARRFKDYCPNGLQVEGRERIVSVMTGVTASQNLLDAAVAAGVDAVLVHHGYFWRGEEPTVTGVRRRRLQSLLSNDINLFAYHLPLDAHPQLGNNAQWAQAMAWVPDRCFGDQDIAWLGRPAEEGSAAALCARLSQVLNREAFLVGNAERQVRRLAWCSGGAQSWFESAIAQGVDCFVSGEISEQTVHLARESDVPYIAAGHHATEKFGVQAVGRALADHFGISVTFYDDFNPV